MKTLITICSRAPNPFLYNCISQLYKVQIQTDPNYTICVVDSDSSDLTHYDLVKGDFPAVEIHFCKNRNYEYGAWKYALSTYPDYDTYFCIQDTIIIQHKLDLSIVNGLTAYTFHNYSGFTSHVSLKPHALNYLKDSGVEYASLFDKTFTLAQHSMFIVTNSVIKDIFRTYTVPAIDKDGSCCYERLFGLYFLHNKINTIDCSMAMTKYNGRRV